MPTTLEKRATHWSGFKGVQYYFAFGDSYTTTGFDIHGQQPSPPNPLGNPAYPGLTTANGEGYVDFLTYNYNKSYVQSYNFAQSGATINNNTIAQISPAIHSGRQQVEQDWVNNYVNNSAVPWTAANSLFSFFFGINDITNTYQKLNPLTYPFDINDYQTIIDFAYDHGARNFLVFNVPPIYRSPGYAAVGATAQLEATLWVTETNQLINNMASNLRSNHSDITVFVYDAYTSYNNVLNNVASRTQTAPIKNTTNFCAAYEFGTRPNWYAFDPSCGVPVDEYFWIDLLHPGFRMQNASAADIAALIG